MYYSFLHSFGSLCTCKLKKKYSDRFPGLIVKKNSPKKLLYHHKASMYVNIEVLMNCRSIYEWHNYIVMNIIAKGISKKICRTQRSCGNSS